MDSKHREQQQQGKYKMRKILEDFFGFLLFSGGIEIEYWSEEWISLKQPNTNNIQKQDIVFNSSMIVILGNKRYVYEYI